MKLETMWKRIPIGKLWMGLVITVLCLVMGTKPVQAFENEYSFLYVDGTYLVKNGQLLCTKFVKDNGTVTYDVNNNVLTLENYHATVSPGIAMQDMSGIRIVFKGINSINTRGTGIDADQNGLMTISGGTVNMTIGTAETYGTGITTRCSPVVIENCTMNINSSSSPISCGESVTIRNSNIALKRTGVDEINNPNRNNNIYNERQGFAGLSTSNVLTVENSTLDITGINYGIGMHQLPVMGENLEITDEKGNTLHPIKIHWPYWWMNGYSESFIYAYSASTQEDLYYFDELPNRVLIKPQKTTTDEEGGKDNSDNENTPGKNPEEGTENGTNSGKKRVTRKIDKSYYTGVPASGKVAYVKPASKNITKITIPATVKIDGYVCKVTSIEKNAFKGCKKLKSVKIGTNVQTIGERAFYQCISLTKISVPKNVKTIKKEAFAGCKKIQSVTFQGKKVTSIGKNAFKDTKKKMKVSMPKSKYKAYKKLLKGTGLKSPVYKKI